MELLPLEIRFNIYEYLKYDELEKISYTCKQYNSDIKFFIPYSFNKNYVLLIEFLNKFYDLYENLSTHNNKLFILLGTLLQNYPLMKNPLDMTEKYIKCLDKDAFISKLPLLSNLLIYLSIVYTIRCIFLKVKRLFNKIDANLIYRLINQSIKDNELIEFNSNVEHYIYRYLDKDSIIRRQNLPNNVYQNIDNIIYTNNLISEDLNPYNNKILLCLINTYHQKNIDVNIFKCITPYDYPLLFHNGHGIYNIILNILTPSTVNSNNKIRTHISSTVHKSMTIVQRNSHDIIRKNNDKESLIQCLNFLKDEDIVYKILNCKNINIIKCSLININTYFNKINKLNVDYDTMFINTANDFLQLYKNTISILIDNTHLIYLFKKDIINILTIIYKK